jgi:hypothetical protein
VSYIASPTHLQSNCFHWQTAQNQNIKRLKTQQQKQETQKNSQRFLHNLTLYKVLRVEKQINILENTPNCKKKTNVPGHQT